MHGSKMQSLRDLKVSHFEPGVVDIRKEFYFPQNRNLRFHDSQGYEMGEIRKQEVLKEFIVVLNGSDAQPSERIHLVW